MSYVKRYERCGYVAIQHKLCYYSSCVVCSVVLVLQVAFSLVKIIGLRGGVALGLFASGCAPGGGASNMYTYMLGGDVSLSITMTLISVFASLGQYIAMSLLIYLVTL